MTTNNDLVKDEDKSFYGDYIICEQCEWNGVPDQKIIMVYLGIRPVNEPGFIYKFVVYDYSIGTSKKLHAHKYCSKVIGRLVDDMLSLTRGCSQ